MKSMKQSVFQIPKNPKYSNIMERPRCSHELTNNVNGIRDVRSSDNEIKKIPNQLSIKGSIEKWFSIMSIRAIVVFDGCVDYLAVRDSSSRDKIRCVLDLNEIVTIGG